MPQSFQSVDIKGTFYDSTYCQSICENIAISLGHAEVMVLYGDPFPMRVPQELGEERAVGEYI